ncbi:hypothetical protein LV178_01610, partial [Burkholderia mallei]|nr:hypothetical protein [Burkholderia mallei]
PPDIHKIRRQVTQSFSKSPRFSAMNQKKTGERLVPRLAARFAALLRLFLRLSSRLSRLLPHHVGPPLDRMPAARARVDLRGIAPPNRLRAGRD